MARTPRVKAFLDWLFGYDFFISYAHADGVTYPSELRAKLAEHDPPYSAHRDVDDFPLHQELPDIVRRQIRRSRALVVLARPAALSKSTYVRDEVEEAERAGRPIFVVEINRSIQRLEGAPRPRGTLSERKAFLDRSRRIVLEDEVDGVDELDDDGTPSDAVVAKLIAQGQLVSVGRIRLVVLTLTMLLLAALATGAVIAARDARTSAAALVVKNRVLERSLAVAQARTYRDTFPNRAGRRLLEALQTPSEGDGPSDAYVYLPAAKELAVELLAATAGTPLLELGDTFEGFQFVGGAERVVAWGPVGAVVASTRDPALQTRIEGAYFEVLALDASTLLLFGTATDEAQVVRLDSTGARVGPRLAIERSLWSPTFNRWGRFGTRIAARSSDAEYVWALTGTGVALPDSKLRLTPTERRLLAVWNEAGPRSPNAGALLAAADAATEGEIDDAFYSAPARRLAVRFAYKGGPVIRVFAVDGDRLERVSPNDIEATGSPQAVGTHALVTGYELDDVYSIDPKTFGARAKPAQEAPSSVGVLARSETSGRLAFSPQTYVAEDAYENSRLVVTYDIDGGRPVKRDLEGHDLAVRAGAFVRGGARLVTGGDDKRLLLWNVAYPSGLARVIHAHDDSIADIANDGTSLFTVSKDGHVREIALDRLSRGRLPLAGPGSLRPDPKDARAIWVHDDQARIVEIDDLIQGRAPPDASFELPDDTTPSWFGAERIVALGYRAPPRIFHLDGKPAESVDLPEGQPIGAQSIDDTTLMIGVAHEDQRSFRFVDREGTHALADFTGIDDDVVFGAQSGCLRIFWGRGRNEQRLANLGPVRFTLPASAGPDLEAAVCDRDATRALTVHLGRAATETGSTSVVLHWWRDIVTPRWSIDLALGGADPNAPRDWDTSEALGATCSPDGRWCAVGHRQGRAVLLAVGVRDARVVEVDGLRAPYRFGGVGIKARPWGATVFAPDSRHAVLQTETGEGVVLRLEPDRRVRQILRLPYRTAVPRLESNAVPRIQFHGGGRWLTWAADEVRLWDLSAAPEDVPQTRIVLRGLYDGERFHSISFPGNSDADDYFGEVGIHVAADGRFVLANTPDGWRIAPLSVDVLRAQLEAATTLRSDRP